MSAPLKAAGAVNRAMVGDRVHVNPFVQAAFKDRVCGHRAVGGSIRVRVENRLPEKRWVGGWRIVPRCFEQHASMVGEASRRDKFSRYAVRVPNGKKRVWFWGASVTLFLGLVASLRVSAVGVEREVIRLPGVDQHQFHQPLTTGHPQVQEMEAPGEVSRLGFILVTFAQAENVPRVSLVVRDARTGEVLRSGELFPETFRDDRYTFFEFSESLEPRSGRVLRVELSSAATFWRNAPAVRFDPTDVYPAGRRFEKGKVVSGDLAFSLYERVRGTSALRVVMRRIFGLTRPVVIPLAAAGALAFLSLSVRFPPRLWKWGQRRWAFCVLGVLMVLALFTRLGPLAALRGVSGGDAYNYLSIAQRLTRGENPFTEEKRLPGFSLLLTPSLLLGLDDIRWERTVSVLSAVGSLGALVGLVRVLGLPWSVAVVAVGLLAWQRDFFVTSLRPEPYSFYALLLLLTTALAFRLTTPKRQLLFGALLGFAAITRHEGLVLAVVLGTIVLLQRKILRGSGLLRSLGPLFLFLLPVILLNASAYGTPWSSPYVQRLPVAGSWSAIRGNLAVVWGVIGSLWSSSWVVRQQLPFRSLPLLLGFLAALLGGFRPRGRQRRVFGWLFVGFWVALLGSAGALLAVGKTERLAEFLTASASGFLLGSVPLFLRETRWRGAGVLAVLGSQLLVVSAVRTYPKHYQHILPLLLLLLSVALVRLSERWNLVGSTLTSRGAKFLARTALLFPFAFSLTQLYGELPSFIARSNAKTAVDAVTYRAVKAASKFPGPYAFDRGEQIAYLYFGQHVLVVPKEVRRSGETLAVWLRERQIRTLVVTASEELPAPRGWRKAAQFEEVAGDIRASAIYESP